MRERSRSRRHDPLAALEVIDRLEIGPPRLEPRRLKAKYTVTQGGHREHFEFAYRYDEPVFDPADAASQNLAAVMAAQVALNYGLFCKQLVLHGPFDNHDQRFLKEMLRNIAREIYVNKLLQENPFLVGAATELPTLRLPSYVRCELVFAGERYKPAADASWPTAPTGHAVLSSGGKDSLLTYGLLQELGAEPHPLFVNESGRHWFSALNAHRALQKREPRLGRVWTNSDRLFAWMLRRLPFVRRDFARLRADGYPIRLWTVAVFVFGVLPLLRKRGLGRLLIGDEFDATQQAVYRGISHYSGYYDQSIYFDKTLTRYYRRKGFGVAQFSALRSLSELLIEKVLAERYPKLLKQQVSCHATHIEKGRVLPCGACEKCRRIVGMLLALEADPKRCGYTRQQVTRCLDDLQAKGVHQERIGIQQLGHMLRDKGLVSGKALGSVLARPRPEVLKLRFDTEHAPIDAVPADLRVGLHRILAEHADGAVQRRGRMWVEVDPLSDEVLTPPYPLEARHGAGGSAAALHEVDPSIPSAAALDDTEALLRDANKRAASTLLGHLTWPAAQRRLAEIDLALLPVGAVEQHGPHLPLDTDAWDADWLARQVAARCSVPRPLVLPLLPYGVSYHHDDFSGTISVSPDALSSMVYEVGISLARNGITKLVIINGHGGNAPALKFAAQRINCDAHIFTTVDTGETSDADIAELIETPGDVHAGEVETSTALATRAELVDMTAATPFVPQFSSRYLNFSSSRSVEWYARTKKLSPQGVLGDPTKASAEKGQRIWEVMIRNLVAFVEQLKGMTLDEIHQRRY